MKKIAITGGKGGTGKSTFSVLLASRLIKKGKKVVLVDCDIECPNDYLLLSRDLGGSVEKVYALFPKLNKEKCKKCGLCVKTCKENAIFQKPGNYPIFMKDLCSACGACSIVCPNNAIEEVEEKIGDIYLSQGKLPLITGLSKAGTEETSPIVHKTKKFALDYAKKINADYLLFDTAAGTHCPVIAALLDSDEAFCVTEPTPMGAYDLKLILDLCNKLGVKSKIVINQADLGDKKRIEKIAEDFNIDIVEEIPYSKKIVEHYSKGNLVDYKE